MSAEAAPAQLRVDLDGDRLGTGGGAIICDGCNAALNLAKPSEERSETVENPHSEEFVVYATEYPAGWATRLIYCDDCDDEHAINAPTEGAEEAIVRVNVEFIGLSAPPCMIVEIVDVLEYSGEGGGDR